MRQFLRSTVLCLYFSGAYSSSCPLLAQGDPGRKSDAGAVITSESPCAVAISRGIVCLQANEYGAQLFSARHLTGAVVIQNVRTGALIAFASGHVQEHDAFTVTTRVLPLSIVKLLLAASWWEREKGASPVDVHEMLVMGLDSPGRQLALALRQAVGSEAVLANLRGFGFRHCSGKQSADQEFWQALAKQFRPQLVPPKACVTLTAQTWEAEWASALSIGEEDFSVTLLHISRFLQAVGNNGVMLPPFALDDTGGRTAADQSSKRKRVMRPETAQKLQSAMKDVVDHGTARGIRGRLGTEWMLGGKTGSGPGTSHPTDGVFAGLVFDRDGVARYTIVSYVQRGGPGGGAAAEIASDLVRFMLGLGK